MKEHPKRNEIMKEVNWAYLAGLIDGEGCISIIASNPKSNLKKRWKSPRYCLRLSIGNTNTRMTDWLKSMGFRIYGPRQRLGKRDFYVARLTDRKAADILKGVLPYLTAKYEEALIGLALQAHKKRQGWNKGLSPEDLAYRESLKQQLHALKRGETLSISP